MDKIVFAKVKDNAQIPARDSWNAGFDITLVLMKKALLLNHILQL